MLLVFLYRSVVNLATFLCTISTLFTLRDPYRRAIFQVISHRGKICVGFGILITRLQIPAQEPQHTVSLLCDPVDVNLPG